MNRYITKICVNRLFHLGGFEIPVADDAFPHLIITGRNGSGKTVLLNAVADYLESAKDGGAVDESKVSVEFSDAEGMVKQYREGNFIVAFYQADRKSDMVEPKSPTKPRYSVKGGVKETATGEFLNFLSDLKIQEALARNEGQNDDADGIAGWFEDFEGLLGRIYQDEGLRLEFNYKDYSFRICTEGKPGYRADR